MKYNIIIFAFLAVAMCGCKKLIEVDGPVDRVNENIVFQSNTNAVAAVTSLYATMSQNNQPLLSLRAGLSADEFKLNDQIDFLGNLYRNALNANFNPTSFDWSQSYEVIFRANLVLEGLETSTSLDVKLRDQLIGEAKFVRAFEYFNLVNLFGALPNVRSTDYKVNNRLPRSNEDAIYALIIEDLRDASVKLEVNYRSSDGISPTEERLRPNQFCAKALLSRVFLFRKNWPEAELMANEVISASNLYRLAENLDEVFHKNSHETIWELQPLGNLEKTAEAKTFILTSGPNGDKPVSLSSSLYESFTDQDLRKSHWIGVDNSTGTPYYFPYKYKLEDPEAPVSEYSVVLRLAEQYLIRAEARVQQGKLVGSNSAESDINVIRNRADLPNTQASSPNDLLFAIENERRLELFSEWGHRWFDLKRTGRANNVMPDAAIEKGGVWVNTSQLYPIPGDEILKNPNLNPQNPGY